MNYRLVKYTKGSKTWYEIQKYIKWNFFGRLYFGFDGQWILMTETKPRYYRDEIIEFSYDDEEKARLKFSEIEQNHLDELSEIEKEILKDI
jgi:hypothetical protein